LINQFKYINELNTHFEILFSECENLIQSLSQMQLNFKYAQEKWTIAQILDHLIIVNKSKTIKEFTPQFDEYDINVKSEFSDTMLNIKKFIQKINDFDINEGKVKFVKDNFIDVNIGDVAKIVLVHIERHLDQINTIIESDKFPTA